MITLDREKKAFLLQALANGEIDEQVIRRWYDTALRSMSESDIMFELMRLQHCGYPSECLERQQCGLCYELNNRRPYPDDRRYNTYIGRQSEAATAEAE